MSEKLTVAELLARNAKAGGKNASDRPRRRRNLDEGGISVSELTGSIPVVRVDGDEAQGSGSSGDATRTHGGHEADPVLPVPRSGTAAPEGSDGSAPVQRVGEYDQQPTVVQAVVPDSLLESPAPAAQVPAEAPEESQEESPEESQEPVSEDAPADGTPQDADAGEDAGDAAATAAQSDTAVTGDIPDAPVTTAAAEVAEVAETAGPEEDTDPSAGQPAADSTAVPVTVAEDEVVEYEDDTISWPAMIGQALFAVVVGVLIFFGFTVLWDRLGTALVLAMALVVTFVCVGVVHALLRHRDTLLLVLTFVVGLALTVGPRLILAL